MQHGIVFVQVLQTLKPLHVSVCLAGANGEMIGKLADVFIHPFILKNMNSNVEAFLN